MREISKIVVHCSATRPDMDVGAKDIRGWHKMRGFSDIGYHFVIRRSGEVEYGRDIDTPGAHARGHNHNSVGICLVGGVNDNGDPEENYTSQQYRSLRNMLTQIIEAFERVEVMGHRDLARKACPCFDVQAWWRESK